MLIVEIFVNERLIGKETAVRIIGGTKPDDMNTYEMSDGCQVVHRYGDGAAKLAQLMMEHLQAAEGVSND